METELSRIGQQHFASKNDKKAAVKEVWQELIASRRMGYMATLRNLRHMLDALVDSASMEQVCNYLANPEAGLSYSTGQISTTKKLRGWTSGMGAA